MAQLQISGTLTCQPTSSADGTFPGGSDSIPLGLNPSQKPASVDTGVVQANINSPGSYATLPGVGAAQGNAVTQGNFLYLRTKVPVLVQLTVNNPAGGTTTIAGIPVNGTFILEFDATRYLVGLAVQGSGVVEWFVSGNL